MVEDNGWQRPARYTTVDDEVDSLTTGAGICDISPVGKLRLQGEDIDTHLAPLFDGYAAVETGRSHIVTLHGAEQQAVIARLAADDVLFLTVPNEARDLLDALTAAQDICAHVVNVTSTLAGVTVAGPLAHRLLAALTEVDVSPDLFPDMSCAQGMVAEVHGTLLRRDIGELANYELYFGSEYGQYMWEALTHAGERYASVPFGVDALEKIYRGGRGDRGRLRRLWENLRILLLLLRSG